MKKAFPELEDSILGEESNKFTNKLGNCLTVEVKDTMEETKELLVKVLDNNQIAVAPCSTGVVSQVLRTKIYVIEIRPTFCKIQTRIRS